MRCSTRICFTSQSYNYVGCGATKVPNYFNVLGVHPNASQSEIKAAFYGLAKTHHPDISASSQKAVADAKFKLINEAYQALSRDKALYDLHSREASRHSTSQSHHRGGPATGASSRASTTSGAQWCKAETSGENTEDFGSWRTGMGGFKWRSAEEMRSSFQFQNRRSQWPRWGAKRATSFHFDSSDSASDMDEEPFDSDEASDGFDSCDQRRGSAQRNVKKRRWRTYQDFSDVDDSDDYDAGPSARFRASQRRGASSESDTEGFFAFGHPKGKGRRREKNWSRDRERVSKTRTSTTATASSESSQVLMLVSRWSDNISNKLRTGMPVPVLDPDNKQHGNNIEPVLFFTTSQVKLWLARQASPRKVYALYNKGNYERCFQHSRRTQSWEVVHDAVNGSPGNKASCQQAKSDAKADCASENDSGGRDGDFRQHRKSARWRKAKLQKHRAAGGGHSHGHRRCIRGSAPRF